MSGVKGMHGKSIEQRFWEKVDRRGLDECWLWIPPSSGPYGLFWINGSYVGAHRVSWELTNGQIPSGSGYHGTCVCHKCDTPKCVNPRHLFLGSHAENSRDKAQKGRAIGNTGKGEKSGFHKLTNDDVRSVFAMSIGGASQRKIADSLGVSQVAISCILTGKTWSHLGLNRR